jgi:4-amino-4-deoxy-L-arabinose transferase-like glycosyltransferase
MMLNWLERRAHVLLIALVTVGVVLRLVLAVLSPQPYGYVFDLYHRAIQFLYTMGRLPQAKDCWVCAHPPLLTLLGWPFYWLGMWFGGPEPKVALRCVSVIPLACGAIAAVYSYRLLQLLRFAKPYRVLGAGLVLSFPCLFISSYGIESDILLTALMTVALHGIMSYHLSLGATGPRHALGLGMLIGLALLTKYSAMVALATAGAVIVISAFRRTPRRALADGALLLATSLAICGWKYADNIAKYRTPFAANGMAVTGFAVADKRFHFDIYEFGSFRLRDTLALWGARAPDGKLTNFPVYYSVFTTLHAQAWTDMSFFSVPSRHGLKLPPYPRKRIPEWVLSSVLVLGIVPTVLALLGVAVTLRRRLLWPLPVYCLLGLGSYLWWFAAQETWSLKTKYILFLLPVYVCYTLLGIRCLRSWWAPLGEAAALLLAGTIVAAHAFQLAFAIG